MAAVRKDADTILLMDDDIVIECHPKSWKELGESVNSYFTRYPHIGFVTVGKVVRPRPIHLQFKHLSSVVFNEPISVPMQPKK